MNQEQMQPYEDLLPEGALPMSGFRLLTFINSKGQICYQFGQSGDIAVSQFIGMLELAKQDIMLAAHATRRRADD